jgi:hypothetical protein
VLNLPIWLVWVPVKLSQLDYTFSSKLLRRVVVEKEVFHQVNVDEDMKHMASFHVSWASELQMRFSPPLWYPARVLAEGPAGEEPHVFPTTSGLLHMMNDRFIAENLGGNVLEPSMVQQTFYAELDKVWHHDLLTHPFRVPGMEIEINWAIRNSASGKESISGSSFREHHYERLWVATDDLEFKMKQVEMVTDDFSYLLLGSHSPIGPS